MKGIIYFSLILLLITSVTFAEVIPSLPNNFKKDASEIIISEPLDSDLSLIDQYCHEILNINKINPQEIKQYETCLLNKELSVASNYYPSDRHYNDYFQLPKKQKKKIIDHLVYKIIFGLEKKINKKEALILNDYISSLKKRAKISMVGIRPIEKIILGHNPWSSKRWNGRQILSLNIKYPKIYGGEKTYDLKPLLSMIGTQINEKEVKLINDDIIPITRTEFINYYLQDSFFSQSRMPASFENSYTKELNQINMEIFLINKILNKKEDIELKFKLNRLKARLQQLKNL